MADPVKPQMLCVLCSKCGVEYKLQFRPNFCSECGQKIDDKDIKWATEPSNDSNSSSDSQTPTQVSEGGNDGLSSDTSQLPSEESASASLMVEATVHPLGTGDKSSSSQPLVHDLQRRSVHDQPSQDIRGPQDVHGQGDIGQGQHLDPHSADAHGQDAYEKDSGSLGQSVDTSGQDSRRQFGRDRSASLVSNVIYITCMACIIQYSSTVYSDLHYEG